MCEIQFRSSLYINEDNNYINLWYLKLVHVLWFSKIPYQPYDYPIFCHSAPSGFPNFPSIENISAARWGMTLGRGVWKWEKVKGKTVNSRWKLCYLVTEPNKREGSNDNANKKNRFICQWKLRFLVSGKILCVHHS